MATIAISTRKTATGKRYDVRYRLGGRTYPASGRALSRPNVKRRHVATS